MELEKSIEIVYALSQGIDPLTGETLPPGSPYDTPDVIRALHTVLEHVKSPARQRKLTPEQKQAANLERGMPKNAGMPWTDEYRRILADDFRNGKSVDALALRFARTRGSILAELKRQGLISVEEARTLQVNHPE